MRKKLLFFLWLLTLLCANIHAYKFGYFNSENKCCEALVKTDLRTYAILTPKEYDVDLRPTIVAYFVRCKEANYQIIPQIEQPKTSKNFCFLGDTEYSISSKNRGYAIAASVAFWCGRNKREITEDIIKFMHENIHPTEICKLLSSRFYKKNNLSTPITIALLTFDAPEFFEEMDLKKKAPHE